jgi:hypothetical protein
MKTFPGASGRTARRRNPGERHTRAQALAGLIDDPELERLSTEAAGDVPEFDRKRAKHLQYASAAALALAGLGAAAGSPLATQVMARTSQGLSTGAGQMRETHARRLDAYWKRALAVEEKNADIANREAELRADAARQRVDLEIEGMEQERADRRLSLDEEAEDRRGYQAWKRAQLDEERLGEQRRHNRATEETQRLRAENTGRDRSARGVTGALIALQQIETERQSLEQELQEINATTLGTVTGKERAKEIQKTLGRLAQERVEITRDLEGLDLDTYLQREGAGSVLDAVGGRRGGRRGGERSGDGSGGSKYGLEDLFE